MFDACVICYHSLRLAARLMSRVIDVEEVQYKVFSSPLFVCIMVIICTLDDTPVHPLTLYVKIHKSTVRGDVCFVNNNNLIYKTFTLNIHHSLIQSLTLANQHPSLFYPHTPPSTPAVHKHNSTPTNSESRY